jgi:hypothetical protein
MLALTHRAHLFAHTKCTPWIDFSRYFKEEGAFFENHVAAQPVCGPSRSSLLLGRYPHNTGYLANSDDASTAAYLKQHNHTTGKWLKDAGYCEYLPPPVQKEVTDSPKLTMHRSNATEYVDLAVASDVTSKASGHRGDSPRVVARW